MNHGIGIDITFLSLATLAVVTGWRVFRTDSMVRASFFLLVSFIAVGVIMILLAAEYLGVAMFFMMAVEMTVMALFTRNVSLSGRGLSASWYWAPWRYWLPFLTSRSRQTLSQLDP